MGPTNTRDLAAEVLITTMLHERSEKEKGKKKNTKVFRDTTGYKDSAIKVVDKNKSGR